ncbi:MAG TPA: arylsulfatase [Microlunatus sp.]
MSKQADGPDAVDPYADFGGTIGRTFSESRPSWRPEPNAYGRPNIVIIYLDDLGFSDIGPYGSEIRTPHLDRLADGGVRFTNYHTTPLCSPSRAALLTGLNPHRAGFAVPANSDPGYPAYTFELPDDTPTVAESLQQAGYATFAVGKWHLTGDRSLHDAASRRSWPLQRGFDRYFGSMEGLTSLHAPHRLIWDNSPYDVDHFADDYYLTDDLTDRAVAMIKSLRASDQHKPFLLYFAHHAVHGPIQAKAADIASYQGSYDTGWDHIRDARFRRQIELGLFGPNTRLPAPNSEPGKDVPPWSSLSDDQQRLFARYMETYAAAVTAVDDSVGRIVQTLELYDELDDTIIVFASDNGGTAEGGRDGTRSYFSQFAHLQGLPDDWDRDVERDLELVGGPQTTVHYPRGWGQVSNTPFRLYKSDTFAGGIRAPLLVHWPKGRIRGQADDGLRRQYVHVTDLTPTLLELAGVPRAPQRQGLPAPSTDGVSAAALVRSANAPTGHTQQYSETGGNRAFQNQHFKIVTNHRPGRPYDDAEWQLYDLVADPTETTGLADQRPELLAELAAAWEQAAWQNRVFPLNDHGPAAALRRPDDDHFGEPVTLYPGTGTLERVRSARLLQHRDLEIIIELQVTAGDQGVLVSHGDQGGGYLVAVEADDRGEPAAFFVLNAYGRMHRTGLINLGLGHQRLIVRFQALPDFRWNVILTDGVAVVDLAEVPQLVGMAPFTGISIGADRGGPVDWELTKGRGSFGYTGTLGFVRYVPGPYSTTAPSERARVWAEGAHIYD